MLHVISKAKAACANLLAISKSRYVQDGWEYRLATTRELVNARIEAYQQLLDSRSYRHGLPAMSVENWSCAKR
jgi:hypothetical protein